MNVLDVQNLTLSFGENTLFSDLSFDIQDKEKVGFVGVNGAGKTSLFKIITGEYKADSGNCFISKNARLGYMEQHTCSNDKTIWAELVSVYDDLIQMEIELDSINEKLKTNHSKELIDRQEYLNDEFTRNGGLTYKSMTRSALLGLGFSEEDFDKPTSKLSGGQKSKLILAKLLLSKADFLLLDEPTNHLFIFKLNRFIRYTVKKISIVRNNKARAVKIFQKIFKPGYCTDIKMIGRFIKQKKICF